MDTKLTLKQRKFWKCYCETHSLTKSAEYCGSKGKDTASLSVIGYQILKSLQLSLPEMLEAEGLTDKLMAEKTLEGLNADRVQLASYEGKFLDEKHFSDYPTRAKYLELLGRMKGAFVDRTELTGKDGGDLVLQIATSKGKRDKKTINLDED